MRNCTRHKRWFITGVSRGLGLEVAREALGRGHFVAGVVRDEEAARQFEQLAPGRALAYWADVTQKDALACAMIRSCRALAGVDVVFNNAGYGLLGSFQELVEEEARHLFETGFWASWRTMQYFLPGFRERGHGHFLNLVCSGYRGPGWSAVEACNAALQALCTGLAAEAGSDGVRVTLADLGPLQSEWLDHLRGSPSRPEPEKAGDALALTEAATALVDVVETCRSEPLLRLTRASLQKTPK